MSGTEFNGLCDMNTNPHGRRLTSGIGRMIAIPAIVVVSLASPAAGQATRDGALHRAIGSPDDFRLSGSVRARMEGIDGRFRPDAASSDQLLSLRTTIFAEYDTGPVRIGAELHDARGYLQRDDSSADTGVVNALELSQYYVGFDLGSSLGRDSETRITAGRMTMALGSSRLISRQNFRNSTNAYTGIRLERTAPDGRRFVAFWTMPNVRLPSDDDAILANRPRWDRETTDVQLFGVFNAVPVAQAISLETYAYTLVERDAPGFETANRRLLTPGLRIKRAPQDGHVDYEVEAMAQFGSARASRAVTDTTDRDVRAYGLHGEIGYRWNGAWKPRIVGFGDYYSGDRDGGAITRFDPLYSARRFELGPTGLFGAASRSNLVSAGFRAEAKPTGRLDLTGNIRLLRLDSATDSFAMTGVRDRSGRSGRDVGHQFEAQLRYQLVPDVALLDIGFAHIAKGRFLAAAPNSPGTGDTDYGYGAVTVNF